MSRFGQKKTAGLSKIYVNCPEESFEKKFLFFNFNTKMISDFIELYLTTSFRQVFCNSFLYLEKTLPRRNG